jgi:hypothetical protein
MGCKFCPVLLLSLHYRGTVVAINSIQAHTYTEYEFSLTRCEFQTRPFNDVDLWPTDGSQPFVWSTGDQ